MFRILVMTLCVAMFSAIAPMRAYAQNPLSIEEAAAIAIAARDPSVTAFEELAGALSEQAIADGQLPDPRVRVAATNFPVDTFRLGQEPMTQVQVGLQQSFPRGRTLKYRRRQKESEAEASDARAELRQWEIMRDARLAWLELYYWTEARGVIEQSRQAVDELAGVARSIFATGRRTGQDVLRAELERSLRDDRLIEMDRQIEMARADLWRLIGDDAARRPISAAFPELPPPLPEMALRDRLVRHPSVLATDAVIEARANGVNIAKQQYRPGWSLDVGYGLRGGDRPDFTTLGVSLDIPLFTGNRQDRGLAAAKRNRQSAKLTRDAQLLELNRELERRYAEWRRLRDRIEIYESDVTDRASETSDAALTAYRSDVSDFAELIRARLAEFDVELDLLRIKVDHAQAQSRLLFLQGEGRE